MQAYSRWLIDRHVPEVLDIDFLSFCEPWTDEDLRNTRKQRDTIILVAEFQGRVVGYIGYVLKQRSIKVFRLAVHPDWRGRGIGRGLLDIIARKLSEHRRLAVFDVPGEMLSAHKWLAKCGWKALPLVGEDSYRFRILANELCGVVQAAGRTIHG